MEQSIILQMAKEDMTQLCNGPDCVAAGAAVKEFLRQEKQMKDTAYFN